ncbi:MAG: hypothetical protein Ta2A_14330 [Treponemataceae bacterium]|nr:MAG: hypothetical protein Ta2A_14330 [Treponemataceae bacterium]
MKKLIFVLCVFAASVFAPSVVTAQDAWVLINNKNDIAGSWLGSQNVQIPASAEMFLPASFITVSISIAFVKDAKDIQFQMKIDMENFITDWLKIPEIQESGYMTKDDLWELLRQEFSNADVLEKYYIMSDLSDTIDSFLATDSGVEIFLNAKKDKMKIAFGENISFGLGDDGFSEIVLNKK